MKDNLVYSTETGRITQEDQPAEFTGDGIARIRRETKGRKGKGVTTISGINPMQHDLKSLAKTLKQHCGCGGALKGGVIEIQGDVREKCKSYLENLGLTVKLTGG